jgi:hypothetical protein
MVVVKPLVWGVRGVSVWGVRGQQQRVELWRLGWLGVPELLPMVLQLLPGSRMTPRSTTHRVKGQAVWRHRLGIAWQACVCDRGYLKAIADCVSPQWSLKGAGVQCFERATALRQALVAQWGRAGKNSLAVRQSQAAGGALTSSPPMQPSCR